MPQDQIQKIQQVWDALEEGAFSVEDLSSLSLVDRTTIYRNRYGKTAPNKLTENALIQAARQLTARAAEAAR